MLPPILFASFFGAAAAGLYSLANRVLQLPMSLIGGAIGQVFFAEAAEANRRGEIGQLVAGLHSKLAHIGMAPALLLILIGPDLFAIVFGEQWRVAGEFARWMAPWIYLVFVSSPLSTLFAVMEKQVQGLVFQLVLLVSRLGAIIAGAAIGGLMETVILFSSVSALCWLGFLFWLARLAGNSAKSMIYPALSAFGVGMVCLLPVIFVITVDFGVGFFWLIAILASFALVSARYWLMLRKVY
jgi:O-antigen/teichoic acid export membrane protein